MRRKIAVTCALLAALGGCAEKLDTSREVVDDGTFGETLFTLVCMRVAYLESREAFERGEADTIDVTGDAHREICRQGLGWSLGMGTAIRRHCKQPK